ncbi:MAG: hypothetical protein ACRD16_04425, partial [Thermoanaerobaculia bacterium]
MRLRPAAALLAALLILPGIARALTVDEIIAKNIDARGGEARLKAIQSLRLTGKAVFSFGDNTLEAGWGQLQKRPGMIRTEISLQGLTAVTAYDGREGWSLQPFQGRRDAQRSSADDSRSTAQDADLDGVLVDWKEKGHKVDFLGTEDVDGTPALKLRVALKDGDTKYVFLDPDYFLEIRIETLNLVRGVENITETDLGSYEQVNGVWIPFSIDQGQKGAPRNSHITVERAEANVDAGDELFRFPPAGTPIGRAVVASPSARENAASSPPPAPAGNRPPTFDSGVVSGLDARNIGSAAMSG